MPVEKNRRRHRRIPCLNPIRLSWEEQGQPRYAIAKCINVSESGLRIESPYPVPAGTSILLASERINLRGSAKVRSLVRNGSKFLLGIQLGQAIRGDIIAGLEQQPVDAVLIENFNRTDQKV